MNDDLNVNVYFQKVTNHHTTSKGQVTKTKHLILIIILNMFKHCIVILSPIFLQTQVNKCWTILDHALCSWKKQVSSPFYR